MHAGRNTQGNFEGGNTASNINDSNVTQLSNTVRNIVNDIISLDHSKETCLDWITSRQSSGDYGKTVLVLSYCSAQISVEVSKLESAAVAASEADKKRLNTTIDSLKLNAAAFQQAITAYSTAQFETAKQKTAQPEPGKKEEKPVIKPADPSAK